MTYYSFIPDDGHALFDTVGPLGDERKVVLSYSFLSGGECAVSAGRHLEIPTETQFVETQFVETQCQSTQPPPVSTVAYSTTEQQG